MLYGNKKKETDTDTEKLTVKLQAVDRSTIQFWNLWAKGHST